MKNRTIALSVFVFLWSQCASGLKQPQLEMNVSAESIATIALYYKNKPVKGNEFEFPLRRDSLSGKFERTEGYFHLVGNVPMADIAFSESSFVLNSSSSENDKIILEGSFIFSGSTSNASLSLRVPVLRRITQSNEQNGIKIHFSSEKPASDYFSGNYQNTFTLIVTPVL